MGWIYIFVNLINFKVYIGKWSGRSIDDRYKDHINGRGSKHLYNAVQKYGIDNFLFGILHENIPKEQLSDLEIQEIARFDCNSRRGGWGYNKTDGGDGWTSEDASTFALKRVEDGTHNFLDSEFREFQRKIASETNRKRIKEGTHPFLDSEIQRETNRKRIKDGTHNFLDSEFQSKHARQRVEDGTHNLLGGKIQRENARKRIEDGTHPFLDSEIQRENARKRIEDGTHNFLNNHPRTRPEKKQVYWEFILSLPLGIKAARQYIFEKFRDIPKPTIYRWLRKWQAEFDPHERIGQ